MVPSFAKDGTMIKDPVFNRLEATYYTPDLWAQMRYRGLRLEFEGAGSLGTVRNIADGGRKYDISEYGAVLESEIRLLDDKLGIYLYTGIASGDSDVEGLSSDANFTDQINDGKHIDTTIRRSASTRATASTPSCGATSCARSPARITSSPASATTS